MTYSKEIEEFVKEQGGELVDHGSYHIVRAVQETLTVYSFKYELFAFIRESTCLVYVHVPEVRLFLAVGTVPMAEEEEA